MPATGAFSHGLAIIPFLILLLSHFFTHKYKGLEHAHTNVFTYSIYWTPTWENVLLTCASNKDSNQSAHPRSLIRILSVRMKKLCVLRYPKCAQWRYWSTREFAGWSESSLGAPVQRYVFWCCDSVDVYPNMLVKLIWITAFQVWFLSQSHSYGLTESFTLSWWKIKDLMVRAKI